jgi:hypothetical protein
VVEAIAMGSLLDELARREATARQRVEEIREEIAGLQVRLEAEEGRLSRLVIARETVEEVLDEVSVVVEEAEVASGRGVDGGMVAESSPVGVVTVPPWEPGMRLSMLPRTYRDAVEILLDRGGAMRAGKILEAMGLVDVASKREGLRSKLKRLEERGWLVQVEAGLFTVCQEVARDLTGPAAGARA